MIDTPQPPVQVNWTLVVEDGANGTKVFPVNRNSLTIGRDETADIQLEDAHISRHHIRLNRQGELLLVEDLSTVNGTFVNGQQITTPHALQSGDLISFGSIVIKIEKSILSTPPSRPKSPPLRPPTKAKPQWGWFFFFIIGIASFIFIILFGTGLYWIAFHNKTGDSPLAANDTLRGPHITISQAPTTNNPVSINQVITVQALASDPTGVTRLELWANGRKVDEVDTELVQVGPSLNVALQWTPTMPGVHTLEIRAYNTAEVVNIQVVGNIRVVGEALTATPAPVVSPTVVPLLPNTQPSSEERPTPTLIPPIPTSVLLTPPPILTSFIPPTPLPSNPILTINIPTVNVRSGPSTQYDSVGQLVQGAQVEVIGVANVGQGQWWQIRFAAAPDGLGWVSGNSAFVNAINTAAVPVVNAPPKPTIAAVAANPASVSIPPTDTPTPGTPTAAPAPAPAENTILRAPAGKTLLIVSNRSLESQPALLTLSQGKSVGGGREIDTPAGQEVQLVLEPDLYRAMWSSPGPRGGFVHSADFVAQANKVVILWAIPEDGTAKMEVYDQLVIRGEATGAKTPTPTPIISGYTAPPGKAILVVANRSSNNSYAMVTLSGGSYGGGKEIKLDANAEIPLELLPGDYRAIWSSPARQDGFTAGRNFKVSTGEVIISWIVPEAGEVFMQFPGQSPIQVNN